MLNPLKEKMDYFRIISLGEIIEQALYLVSQDNNVQTIEEKEELLFSLQNEFYNETGKRFLLL